MTALRAVPAVAAYAAGVQVATLRQWVRRGHISPTDQDGCYNLNEILDYSDKRTNGNRYHQALAARHRRVTCETASAL